MQHDSRLLVRQFDVKRVRAGGSERVIDTIAAEEPLEIRVQYWFKDAPLTQSLAVTMRTPGADLELAAGFLVAEGIIHGCRDLHDLRILGAQSSNEILAELAPNVDFEAWRMSRAGFVSSSCGICGKRSRDAISQDVRRNTEEEFLIARSVIESLPEQLREHQAGFEQTGGLHAAALADRDGRIQTAFEDIGRHNALDKLVGWCLLNDRFPLSDHVLFMSSRSSFELIQKAAMAGARVLATVGGPSSLAVEAARDYGITLVGFVRDSRFNIYSGDWRVRV